MWILAETPALQITLPESLTSPCPSSFSLGSVSQVPGRRWSVHFSVAQAQCYGLLLFSTSPRFQALHNLLSSGVCVYLSVSVYIVWLSPCQLLLPHRPLTFHTSVNPLSSREAMQLCVPHLTRACVCAGCAPQKMRHLLEERRERCLGLCPCHCPFN